MVLFNMFCLQYNSFMMDTICRSSMAAVPGTSVLAASAGGILQDDYQQNVSSPTHMRGSVLNTTGPPTHLGLTADGRQTGLFASERQAIYDEGTLEYLSAEMSFSALYMHDIHMFRLSHGRQEAISEDDRARAVWQTDTSLPPSPPSFMPMPNIQEEDDAGGTGIGETDYLLRV